MRLTCSSVVEVLVDELGNSQSAIALCSSSGSATKTYVVGGLRNVAESWRRYRRLEGDLDVGHDEELVEETGGGISVVGIDGDRVCGNVDRKTTQDEVVAETKEAEFSGLALVDQTPENLGCQASFSVPDFRALTMHSHS